MGPISEARAAPKPAYVKLLCTDVDASVRFYQALGFTVDARDAVFVRLRFAQDAYLYLVKTPLPSSLEGKRGLGVLLCFTAQDPTVEEVTRRALALGVIVDGPRPTPWHTLEAVMADPDGYRLNFVRPLSSET